ncbi:MAG: NPCBM/NEW2 domain-containing protein, partial [Cyclobacteriaceae bacterium]
MKSYTLNLISTIFLLLIIFSSCEKEIHLNSLNLENATSYYGKSVANKNLLGDSITVSGKKYTKSICVHPTSRILLDLGKKSDGLFLAEVGVDDASVNTEIGVNYYILGDGYLLWSSDTRFKGSGLREVFLNFTDVRELELVVEETKTGRFHTPEIQCHWIDPVIKSTQIKEVSCVSQPKLILTPKKSNKPQINASKVFGVRPSSPILFNVSTSGQRPMQFSAQDLPDGVSLNVETGLISGKISKRGEYKLRIQAENEYGKDSTYLIVKVGDDICLTPPMGWNSWYCWSESVNDKKIRDIADAFVYKGLNNYGWSYINIDDCWQGQNRGGKFNAVLPD